MKTCTKCAVEQPLENFYEDKRRGPRGVAPGTRIARCKKCHTSQSREQYQANHSRERARQRSYNLRINYGLTTAEYDSLLEEQGGGCAICSGTDSERRLAVDHCHDTGKVRGLLCTACNVSLGRFKDDPELLVSAAIYLEAARVH
jgi:hypothetical protein